MVSELATNCVQHAQTDFELTIRSRDHIRVEVRDSQRRRPTLRSPTPREPSGRGLRIVEAMSEAWGITPSANGKIVWFTLRRASGSIEPRTNPAGIGVSREVNQPDVSSASSTIPLGNQASETRKVNAITPAMT
jgi:hypothetical protein